MTLLTDLIWSMNMIWGIFDLPQSSYGVHKSCQSRFKEIMFKVTHRPLWPLPQSINPQAGFESRITCDSVATPSQLIQLYIVHPAFLTYLYNTRSWINATGITFNKNVICKKYQVLMSMF